MPVPRAVEAAGEASLRARSRPSQVPGGRCVSATGSSRAEMARGSGSCGLRAAPGTLFLIASGAGVLMVN